MFIQDEIPVNQPKDVSSDPDVALNQLKDVSSDPDVDLNQIEDVSSDPDVALDVVIKKTIILKEDLGKNYMN